MNTQQRADKSEAKILIVDDKPENLRLLTGILKEKGYTVRQLRNGDMVMSSVLTAPPDLILLDILMPETDGYEVCRQLKAKEQTRDIPVIFISALDEAANKVKAFSVGGIDYIAKPFQEEEVLARIKTHLALKNMQKRLEEKNFQLQEEIDERKRAEEKLRKLSRAVEQSASSVVITDIDGIIEYVNPAFSEITGYSYEEAIGNSLHILKSGKHPPDFYREIRQTLSSGNVWQGEVINRRKSGELYWESAVVSPVKDQEGKITHYLATKDDITVRRQAEEKLLDSEKKYREIVMNANSIIMRATPQWNVTFLNDFAQRFFGYSKDEILGKNIAGMIVPETESTGRNLMAMLEDITLNPEKYHYHENENICKNGNRVWVAWSNKAIKDKHGSTVELLCIGNDITDKKKNEQALKKVNENLKVRVDELSMLNRISGTVAMTSDLHVALGTVIREIGQLLNAKSATIVMFDATGLKLTIFAHFTAVEGEASLVNLELPNLPATDQIITEKKSIVIPDAQTSPLLEPIHELMINRGVQSVMIVPLKAPGKIIGAINISIAQKDRKFMPSEVRLVETIAGQIAGLIENARLFEEAEKARQVAEEANKAKSRFLANMSHEIRTPMNSVLGFLELALEDSELAEIHRKNIKTAYNSARSLLTLLNDILDVSKLESGKLTLEKRPFNLPWLMQDILKIFEIRCRKKGLALSLNMDPKLSSCYIGDTDRLKQILINLVANAVKFTGKGGITLTVEPSAQENMVKFTVRDTGIGISPDRLEHIFEPFVQADTSTSRRFGGTGLGITISRQLTQLMGGDIRVKSEEEKESEFEFTVCMEPSDIIPADFSGKQELKGFGRCFKILVAEDIEENILLAKIRLEQKGHTVIEARNGLEAVEAFKREPPDIILMDIQMPVMDGLETSRRIREIEKSGDSELQIKPAVPIIALTASIMKEEQAKCLQAGMDEIVGKPVDFEKLFEIMEKSVSKDQVASTEMMSDELKKNRTPFNHRSSLTDQYCQEIDFRKGLKIWQNEAVYRKVLQKFPRNYECAGERILEHLKNKDVERAYQIMHELKSVSGNLCITRVYCIANRLNADIRKKPSEELIPDILSLSESVKAAADAIRHFETKTIKSHDPEKKVNLQENLGHLQKIFRRMLAAFDQYNPEDTEFLLPELMRFIPADQVEPLQMHVDNFDFDGAREEALKLMQFLGIQDTA
ncbi:MAG: response regulator [Desulfobacteraceae bacterium]|nr:response regulator [Desulfobacteraceae bacterium]